MKYLALAVLPTSTLGLITSRQVVDANAVITSFKTQPTYTRTHFTIHEITNNTELLAPGYIFIAPVHGARKRGVGGTQSGPQIREQDGTLVWYGGPFDAFGAQGEDTSTEARVRDRVQDMHVCDYMGSKGTHMCWSEKLAHGARRKVVVDQSYEMVQVLRTGYEFDGGLEMSNMHEFNMVDDGYNYLQPAWPNKQADLREVGGPRDGYVWDGCFQDINVLSGNSTFEWCWLDHFPLWETNTYPSGGPNITGNITSSKVGKGTERYPWDAWHVNSIDKNFEGDYLLSTRHDDQILKIAGNDNVHGVEPGTALWRMGGKGGDIEFESDDFVFTKQHGVRYVSTTADETIFSILDNAWEGELAPSAEHSSGMIISVNNVTKTGRLLKRYPHPSGAIAPSQGSLQLLPNKNVFIAWGSQPQFSEFTEDGNLLLHASYANATIDEEEPYSYSYRVLKSPWTGKPTWSPKLVAYTHSCNSGTSRLKAWVSWNGATEVASYIFSISTDRKGTWSVAGKAPRSGFETEVVLSVEPLADENGIPAFPRFVSVQALDAAGKLLPYGEAIAETFVPQAHIRDSVCDEDGCHVNGFDYSHKLSYGILCGRSLLPHVLVLIFYVIVLEILNDTYLRLFSGRDDASWSISSSFPRFDYDHLPSFTTHDESTLKTAQTNGLADDSGYDLPPSPSPAPDEPILTTSTAHARNSSLSSRPGFERTKTPFS